MRREGERGHLNRGTPMILIHGECGSGRTSALRAIEAAPPPGFRAVYVPVPTLDLVGIACWCLDCLALGARAEPVAALRDFAKRQPLLLLLDDAERMPPATAESLASLARESAGAITLIGAGETSSRSCDSIAALGVPELTVALDASSAARVEDAARAVRGQLAPALRSAPAEPPSHTARASARLAGAETPRPVPRAIVEAPSPAVAPAPVRDDAIPPAPPAAPAPREPRTVPLSLAIALAVGAFLIPVAFGAGLWLGRSEPAGPSANEARTLEPVLPAVAAAPPTEEVVTEPKLAPREAPAPLAAETRPPAREQPRATPRVRASAAREPSPRVAAAPEPARAPAQAQIAPPPPVRQPRASVPEARRAAPVEDEWGAPALISVTPGDGGR